MKRIRHYDANLFISKLLMTQEPAIVLEKVKSLIDRVINDMGADNIKRCGDMMAKGNAVCFRFEAVELVHEEERQGAPQGITAPWESDDNGPGIEKTTINHTKRPMAYCADINGRLHESDDMIHWRQVVNSRPLRCEACEGRGIVDVMKIGDGSGADCPKCAGTGVIWR